MKSRLLIRCFVLLTGLPAMASANVVFSLSVGGSGTFQLTAADNNIPSLGLASYGVPIIGDVLTLDHVSPQGLTTGGSDIGFRLLRSLDNALTVTGSQNTVTLGIPIVTGFGKTAGDLSTVPGFLIALDQQIYSSPLLIATGTWDTGGAAPSINTASVDFFANVLVTAGNGVSTLPTTMDGMAVVSEPILGDFNNDGFWNCDDMNALSAAIATGSNDLGFDMNGDGSITLADITDPTDGWLAVGGANNPAQTNGNPFINGDANLSGEVDGSDFGIWNSNKFSSNNAWCSGDFNANGAVDGSDFNEWNSHKFTSSDGMSAVPEPALSFLRSRHRAHGNLLPPWCVSRH